LPRYVSTDRGLGRAEHDTIILLDLPGATLDEAFRAGATADDLAVAREIGTVAAEDVALRAPVRLPGRMWAIAFAYAEHKIEVGRSEVDAEPFAFLKASSSITDPGSAIRLPGLAPDRVDYEGEVAVVIGRSAVDIAEDAAWDHVLGFTAANDVSARDVQKRGLYNGGKPDPSKAKSFDTFTPLGPSVCTLDEYADPADVGLRTVVDGVECQRARTTQLLFSVPRIVSFLSRFGELRPGDVILTGTPSGVGHPEGRFLAPGSVVQVEVEGVGVLENVVEGA
jgi:2-keto-4-pentenoate hydratase/2-oxohepta-3-ene-1,7-dioic acid hydratase in catechol pathway